MQLLGIPDANLCLQNVGPFYGLSMGDFADGQGGIRVECSPRIVAEVIISALTNPYLIALAGQHKKQAWQIRWQISSLGSTI